MPAALDLASLPADSFFGIARIKLKDLDFEYALKHGHRGEDQKVQASLLNSFRLNGCLQRKERNFIIAITTSNNIATALEKIRSNLYAFQGSARNAVFNSSLIPKLKPECPISPLNGLHRKSVAQDFLPSND